MTRSYVDQPTLDIDFIKPQRMSFDVTVNAMEGGRNGLGQTITMETSGGGVVVGSYQNCYVQAREEHEYANWLAARLTGGFRFINVPIKTDWMGPFPVFDRWPVPIQTGIPHSDGARFSDGSGYSQVTVWGEFLADAALNAGLVSIRLYGAARMLRHSDWFSVRHATKGWRVYRYWDVVSASPAATEMIDGTAVSYQDYDLAIAPALREAVSAGDRIEFARPRFVAKLVPGASIPWDVEGFWKSQPTLQFTEAF